MEDFPGVASCVVQEKKTLSEILNIATAKQKLRFGPTNYVTKATK